MLLFSAPVTHSALKIHCNKNATDKEVYLMQVVFVVIKNGDPLFLSVSWKRVKEKKGRNSWGERLIV